MRKAAQIETLKSHVLIAPFVEKGVVEFVVVPDITIKGAFDEALKDVVGVLHIASPLPAPVRISIIIIHSDSNDLGRTVYFVCRGEVRRRDEMRESY